MNTLKSEDWRVILHATAEDVNARLADGTRLPIIGEVRRRRHPGGRTPRK